jgi:trk system potassium uptake protein TrkA
MRIAFIGATPITVMAARRLLADDHEVVIVDSDEERLEMLAEEIDCGLVHGDGSHPAVLKDLSPEHTDILVCFTDSDQTNIIASLVGKSLKFVRVITQIEDPVFQHVCAELGLQEVICSARQVAEGLRDMILGYDTDLSLMLEAGLRVATFHVGATDAGPLEELELPKDTRVIALIRDDVAKITEADTKIEADDFIVVLTHEDALEELEERFESRSAGP